MPSLIYPRNTIMPFLEMEKERKRWRCIEREPEIDREREGEREREREREGERERGGSERKRYLAQKDTNCSRFIPKQESLRMRFFFKTSIPPATSY